MAQKNRAGWNGSYDQHVLMKIMQLEIKLHGEKDQVRHFLETDYNFDSLIESCSKIVD